MKTKSMTILGTAGLLIAAAFPVFAHHSFSAEFDVDKPITIEGTVVKMDWVNPHTWLYIDVKKADGTVEHWQVEGGAPGVLLRNGWTKNTLAPGTRVIVSGHQAKDGAFRANSSNIQFPDGRKLDTGSSYNDSKDGKDK
jgi:DNA/RNA endonuclease YhcR with UshA esterase domain